MNELALDPIELDQLLEKQEGLILLDIRRNEDQDTSNFKLPQAILMPELELASQLSQLRDFGLVVIVCNFGERSRKIANWLDSLGIHTRYLAGGVSRYLAEPGR